MARPLKRTVDYFPHFVNSGKTLLILENEFGNDGYAFWFKLLSLLCKTDGQVYDYNNPAAWRLLLAETHVNEDIANRILQILADIDAIDPDLYLSKIIWVQNLIDNLGDVYTRRRNGSTPEKPVNVNNNPINGNKKPQTILNHTKLNHTNINKNKKPYGEFKNVFLTDRDVKLLIDRFGEEEFKEKVETLSLAIKSKGYIYKDFYSTILKWDRKDKRDSKKQSHNNLPTEAELRKEFSHD